MEKRKKEKKEGGIKQKMEANRGKSVNDQGGGGGVFLILELFQISSHYFRQSWSCEVYSAIVLGNVWLCQFHYGLAFNHKPIGKNTASHILTPNTQHAFASCMHTCILTLYSMCTQNDCTQSERERECE